MLSRFWGNFAQAVLLFQRRRQSWCMYWLNPFLCVKRREREDKERTGEERRKGEEEKRKRKMMTKMKRKRHPINRCAARNGRNEQQENQKQIAFTAAPFWWINFPVAVTVVPPRGIHTVLQLPSCPLWNIVSDTWYAKGASCLFLVSLMQLAVGSYGSSVVPRSLPYTTNATDSKSSKSCSADRSRNSVVALSVACPLISVIIWFP